MLRNVFVMLYTKYDIEFGILMNIVNKLMTSSRTAHKLVGCACNTLLFFYYYELLYHTLLIKFSIKALDCADVVFYKYCCHLLDFGSSSVFLKVDFYEKC